MTKDDLSRFQLKLEKERAEIIDDLGSIARVDRLNPKDWNAVSGKTSEPSSRDETANRLEEWGEREATVGPLETRLANINAALEKIKQNAYGQCIVCKKEIERERLEANPAAATCKQHLDVKY